MKGAVTWSPLGSRDSTRPPPTLSQRVGAPLTAGPRFPLRLPRWGGIVSRRAWRSQRPALAGVPARHPSRTLGALLARPGAGISGLTGCTGAVTARLSAIFSASGVGLSLGPGLLVLAGCWAQLQAWNRKETPEHVALRRSSGPEAQLLCRRLPTSQGLPSCLPCPGV